MRFIAGNAITLLQNGAQYFPALSEAIDQAAFEVHLETYIFENDGTGRRFADTLKRAAQRGVRVHVAVDGFGSRDLPKAFARDLRAAGVEFLYFRPEVSPWVFRRHRLRRLHRKLAVIDRRLAFVGGINIIDDAVYADRDSDRFDYAVKIEGPLVEPIFYAMRRLWMLLSWVSRGQRIFRKIERMTTPQAAGDVRAGFLIRDNLRHRREIQDAYFRAINHARREIIIANAYFLPGIDFRHALVAAAERGVRVVLVLQGRREYFLQHYATRTLYARLLEAGIEIYEYQKSFLHAKVAVVDEHWSTVGSSNIDPFSLFLAREANVVIDDQKFAAELKQSLELAIANSCKQVLADMLKRQPLYERFFGWLGYGLLRIFNGLIGYSEREGSPARKIERRAR